MAGEKSTALGARWPAAKIMHEVYGVPLPLLAQGMALSERRVGKEFTAGGWLTPAEARPGLALAKIMARLSEAIDQLCSGEEGGAAVVSKADLDAVNGLLGAAKKYIDITRPEEGAKENIHPGDEEIAAVIARVDRRIILLARQFAAEKGAEDLGRENLDGENARRA